MSVERLQVAAANVRESLEETRRERQRLSDRARVLRGLEKQQQNTLRSLLAELESRR